MNETEVSPLEEEEAQPSRKLEFAASAAAFVVTTVISAVGAYFAKKAGEKVHDKIVETKK